MTEQEATNFTEQIVRGLWGNWEPQNEELTVWVRKMQQFDYGKARRALGEWFATTKTFGRTDLSRVFAMLRRERAYVQTTGKDTEPVLMYTLRRVGAKGRGYPFYSLAKRLPRSMEPIREEAERNLERAKQIFCSDSWIIEYNYQPEGTENR